jgi:membrane-associated phospholipid phosphatase
VLIWMFVRHSAHYRLARTTLALSTVIGLVGYYFMPTAPPRLLANSGISDTLAAVSDYGWWSNQGSVPRGLGSLSNQFAAMPSLHVGWALWAGALLWRFGRHRVTRWAGAAYPVLTTLVVVATGNHYLLDALAGFAAIALAGAVAYSVTRREVIVEAESIAEDAAARDVRRHTAVG